MCDADTVVSDHKEAARRDDVILVPVRNGASLTES